MMNDFNSFDGKKETAAQDSLIGKTGLDIPEELITLDGRESVSNARTTNSDESNSMPEAAPSSVSPFNPCFVFPLAALIIVVVIGLAAPTQFRLDPTPGVIQLVVENSDGWTRTIPCDEDGTVRLRPGTYHFSISSGGWSLLSKELTLNANGQLLDGDVVLDFDRFAPRLVIDSGNREFIPFVNGRRIAPVNGTVRLPAGRYDVVLLTGTELSEVVRVDLPLSGDTIRIVDYPWRFREGNPDLYEKAVADFFQTLYALEPAAWDAFASEKKSELLDFFYQAFCVPAALGEPFDDGDASPRLEDNDFDRRLALVKEKIRIQIQTTILDLDAAGAHDPGSWRQLLRATAPWENEAIGDWRFYYARSLAFRRLGLWNAAGAELEKSLQIAAENAMLRFASGQVLAQLGRFDEAREEVDKAMRLDPMFENKGRIFLAGIEVREIERNTVLPLRNTLDGSLEKALKLLNEALDSDTSDPEAFYLRSLVYYALGRETDSKNDWLEFESMMKPDVRSQRIEKELRREQWKEKFQNQQLTPL